MSLRCFHRHSTVAWYSSETAVITLRLDLDGENSSEAVTHELTHHDLTEQTVAGKLEQLLGRAAADELRRLREELVTRSFLTHESTATYIAALGERVVGREPVPLAALPEMYRTAVIPLTGIFDDPYAGSPVRFFASQMFATAVARAALDSPEVMGLLDARPRSVEELSEWCGRIDADRLYIRLIHELGETSLRAELAEVVRSLAQERLGIADLALLDARLVEDDAVREAFVPDGDDLLIEALHRRLPGLLGPYVSPAQKAARWAELVRQCQTFVRDFEGIEISGELGSDFEPNFTYVFRSADMEEMWRRVRAPVVVAVAEALRWLNEVAKIAAPRGVRVVLHSRELVNHGESDLILETGDAVPPRGGIMHLDLQLDRVRADGSALTEDDVEAMGAVPQSATARIVSRDEETELFRTVEWMRFPVVWHAGWLVGLAAARLHPNPFAGRPGVSVFYLDQSGTTWKHFAWVLERLAEHGRVEVTRADIFDGASDAYVIREGTSYWSAVFPNNWISQKLRGFTAEKLDAALEKEDAARVNGLVRYGLTYVYELARLRT